MAERKLVHGSEPDVDLSGQKALDQDSLGSTAAERRQESAAATDEYLPPLPSPAMPAKPEVTQGSSDADPELGFVRRASHVVLILMTSGMAGFLTGALGGILLFTGILDIDSTWIKSIVSIFRG